MKISVVIPTLNRPVDLKKAVVSVLNQQYPVSQIIVVDQSDENESESILRELCAASPKLELVYLHEKNIRNLPAAKQHSLQWVKGDIVGFIDDDAELDPDYFLWKVRTFEENPSVMGCCGIEINPVQRSDLYYRIFHFFHRGIYTDERMGVLRRYPAEGPHLIHTDKLSGGSASWRSEVFNSLSFDVTNGLHVIEDMDFSSRAAKLFGGKHTLCICMKARFMHHYSLEGRPNLGPKQKRKVRELVLYFRMRRDWPNATPSFLWLLVGLFLETGFLMLTKRSVGVFAGYWTGLIAGFRQRIHP